MQKVADVFDKGDGMIDAKEFMSKLRYDYRKVNSPFCVFHIEISKNTLIMINNNYSVLFLW